MFDFAGARTRMVDNQLRTSAVTDRRLLAAMGEVPRELFVPAAWRELAYIDAAIPLGGDRALPAPAPFARLVQLAEVAEGERVLDLCCGTGYSVAVLARLAAEVVGVEPESALAETARNTLSGLGVAAQVVAGPADGSGLPVPPFDVIVLENAVDAVPPGLWDRLKDRGRLVALIGRGMTAVAHVFVKTGGEIAGRAEFNAVLPAEKRRSEADAFVF